MKCLIGVILAAALLVSGCGTIQANTRNGIADANAGDQASTSSQVPTNPLVGKLAPNFTLNTLDGHGTMTLKDLKGKGEPILLNAWASWCPPCQQETPDLEEMSKEYAGKMEFVGINMTSDNDTVSNAKGFVQKYHITYPILLDLKGTFSKAYKIIGYPTTFILSPSGKVLSVHLGELTKAQIRQLYIQANKGQPAK